MYLSYGALLKVNHIKIAYKKINKYDQIVAITKYISPIQRALKTKNMLKFLYPKFKFYRSQDLENMYYDSGTFAVYKCSKLFNYRKNKKFKKIPDMWKLTNIHLWTLTITMI